MNALNHLVARARGVIVVAGVIASVVGCSDLQPIGACLDDQACGDGTVCAFGLCVDPGVLGAVDIEVEPAGTSGLPPQAIFGVDTAGGGRADVVLSPSVTVSGGVTGVGGVGGVAATITAISVDFIAGHRRQPSTTSVDGPFSLALVAGREYRVQAQPTDRTLPPILPDDTFVAGADAVPSLLMTSEIDQSTGVVVNHPITVSGRLVAGVGVGVEPVLGVDVLILDTDGRRVSSLERTTSEGTFRLGLAQRLSGLRFVVRPSEQNTFSPTVSFPLDLGDSDVVELGDVSMGAALGSVEVSGEVRTQNGGPARNAVVAFRGLVGAGVAVARTNATDGTFRVSLPPGNYTVAAVGDVATDGGIATTNIDVTAARDDVVLSVPNRVNVDLRIATAGGVPASLASVVLNRIGDTDGISEPVLAEAQPVFVASAGDDGRLTLNVDPGRYRLSIQPPRGSGAPAFSTVLTVIDAVSREITLPQESLVAGTLVDEGGAPVVGAFVRLYSPLQDELGRAIFLGEAISNDDGTFEGYLPVQ